MMTLPEWLAHPAACVELVIRLTAWSTILCAAEVLAARADYAKDACLNWDNLKRFSRLPADGQLASSLAGVFRYPGYIILHTVWLVAAIGLVFSTQHPVLRPALLYVLLGVQGLVFLRHFTITTDASDKTRLMLLVALNLREIVPDGEMLTKATLFFIGGQCTLAYFIAGVFHLPLVEWRNGTALIFVLRHPFFGEPPVADWLARHHWVSRVLTWGVLVLEVGFPLSLLGGIWTVLPALAATLLMHLSLGYLSGLPRFIWSFLAAYPAVIFTSVQVAAWLAP